MGRAARPRLIVMVKAPVPGRVKTRLGRDIGMVPAAWWQRHQMRRLLRGLDDPRWQLCLAVSPDHLRWHPACWPAHLPRIAQGPGDLGDRMGRLLRGLPPGPVCVVGADIPGLRRAHVARAFAALGGAEAVFGPAPDGGYWLVGHARRGRVPAGLFDGVRWSGPQALANSIASLRGQRVALVDTLADVDRAEDL